MADLMRLSQPWLRRSPRFAQLSPLQILICPSRNINISTTLSRQSTPYAKRGANAPRVIDRSKIQIEDSMNFLLPMTLVAPPLWRYPRQPSKFLHMLWLHGKNRAQALFHLIGFKFFSCPEILRSRPKYKAHRANAVPTAKALHVQMSEAVAAGDRETLRAICMPELYKSLVGAIDSRPQGIRTEWELLKYDGTWYYPRLAEWRLTVIPQPSGGMQPKKQAVVSISSVQRIARYDNTKGGAKVEGSERVRHLLEHIVLQANIDDKTYQSGPWKIWGTIPEATYESYLDDVANYEASV